MYQKHIIDSYANCGGYAKKWASEVAVGNPDLVAAMPNEGQHLAEVKHRPDWQPHKTYKNPLTRKQRDVAKEYTKGGGKVYVFIVIGVGTALNSWLYIFDANEDTLDFNAGMYVCYVAGKKYNIEALLRNKGF